MDPASRLGEVLDGRYALEKVLGKGGMGVVYAGRHEVIGRRVAVKLMRPETAVRRDAASRFLAEARAASRIRSEHVVDILDFGLLPSGEAYLVMELVEGTSLSDLLDQNERGLGPERAARLAMQMARGLAAAHQAGIIHRDFKPDNVLVERRGGSDHVKILDFGIAKIVGDTERRTQAGTVFGTPKYMSPEQAMGSEVDARSDVYALGVVLYEMLTGEPPFSGDSIVHVLSQHMHAAARPPSAIVGAAGSPPELDRIVLACLAKKPEERPASMNDLAARLQGFLERPATTTAVSTGPIVTVTAPPLTVDGDGRPTTGAQALPRPSRRRAVALAGGVVSAVALGIAVVTSVVSGGAPAMRAVPGERTAVASSASRETETPMAEATNEPASVAPPASASGSASAEPAGSAAPPTSAGPAASAAPTASAKAPAPAAKAPGPAAKASGTPQAAPNTPAKERPSEGEIVTPRGW